MTSMATCSVRYSKSKVRGQKHPREVVKNRNSIPNLSQYITRKIVNIRCTTGHPFAHQQTHNYMLRPISRIQIHSYIYIYIYIYIYMYTLVQIIVSVQAKLEVVRRKHIVHPTVSVPTPLPVVKGQTTVPAPCESISSHPHASGLHI